MFYAFIWLIFLRLLVTVQGNKSKFVASTRVDNPKFNTLPN